MDWKSRASLDILHKVKKQNIFKPSGYKPDLWEQTTIFRKGMKPSGYQPDLGEQTSHFSQRFFLRQNANETYSGYKPDLMGDIANNYFPKGFIKRLTNPSGSKSCQKTTISPQSQYETKEMKTKQ